MDRERQRDLYTAHGNMLSSLASRTYYDHESNEGHLALPLCGRYTQAESDASVMYESAELSEVRRHVIKAVQARTSCANSNRLSEQVAHRAGLIEHQPSVNLHLISLNIISLRIS